MEKWVRERCGEEYDARLCPPEFCRCGTILRVELASVECTIVTSKIIRINR
jgi:hypothetical protein